MDFSAIAVDKISWSSIANKKSKILYGSQKVRFQTPRTTAKMMPCPKFQGALQLEVDDTTFPDAFKDFMEAIVYSARQDLAEDIYGKTYYSPWKRVTAFDDALVFDAEGTLVKEEITERAGYHEVSMLVQIDGAWISEQSWGIRVRIMQIKIHSQDVKPVENVPRVQIYMNGKPFMFVEDD